MPEIRFLRGPKGARIAYAIHGAGPPLVCPAWWVSHVERDWQSEQFRQLFEPLGAYRTVVRWDRQGSGLSDRERTSYQLDDEVAVLSALVDHLDLPRFDLLGISCGGPPALAYAAQHPERVGRIVLFGSYLDGQCAAPAELRRAIAQLVRTHWGLGAKAITDLFAPDLAPERARQLAEEQRAAASPEMAAALFEFAYAINVAELAPRVSTPVLVLHRRDDQVVALQAGRDLAAALPQATLSVLEGQAHTPWLGELPPLHLALERFLTGAATASEHASERSREPDAFRRHGALWRVAFDGFVAHVPHGKGMSDLAVLLERPGVDVLALELQQGPGLPLADGSAQDVLDEQALGQYRVRVLELEQLIAEAEAHDDLARRERLLHERDAIARELAVATGLGGRRRKLLDPGERARKAVTARIRQAILQIAEVHPALAAHLEASLATGRSCAYRPVEARSWLV